MEEEILNGQSLLEERNKLWQARHDVYWSVKALGNNMKVYSTDVCVPFQI